MKTNKLNNIDEFKSYIRSEISKYISVDRDNISKYIESENYRILKLYDADKESYLAEIIVNRNFDNNHAILYTAKYYTYNSDMRVSAIAIDKNYYEVLKQIFEYPETNI